MSSSNTELCIQHCNLNTLPFGRYCYYIIEITGITLKGSALAVTWIAGKEGTRETKGHEWGKGQALMWICKVTARVLQSHLPKPKKAALFCAVVTLAFITFTDTSCALSCWISTWTGFDSVQFNQLSSYLESLWGTSTASESCLLLGQKIPPRPRPLCFRSKSKRHLCCMVWWVGGQTFLLQSSNVT